jgi:hypothetical protein
MARFTKQALLGLVLAGTTLAAMAVATPARADDPAFLGTWVITQARTAPWAKADSAFSPDEQRRLVGAQVTYRDKRIVAPAPLGCADPHYRISQVPPDYLFQGTLTDPVGQARALGFPSPRSYVLETGCEGLIDFHFVNPTTAMFALNNMLYTLKKR